MKIKNYEQLANEIRWFIDRQVELEVKKRLRLASKNVRYLTKVMGSEQKSLPRIENKTPDSQTTTQPLKPQEKDTNFPS